MSSKAKFTNYPHGICFRCLKTQMEHEHLHVSSNKMFAPSKDCPLCFGSGYYDEVNLRKCDHCGGTGDNTVPRAPLGMIMSHSQSTQCMIKAEKIVASKQLRRALAENGLRGGKKKSKENYFTLGDDRKKGVSQSSLEAMHKAAREKQKENTTGYRNPRELTVDCFSCSGLGAVLRHSHLSTVCKRCSGIGGVAGEKCILCGGLGHCDPGGRVSCTSCMRAVSSSALDGVSGICPSCERRGFVGRLFDS